MKQPKYTTQEQQDKPMSEKGIYMVIENDARRFVIESISAEIFLSQQEAQQKPAQEVNKTRSVILNNICQVNAVANVEGKGRDDFDMALLLKAEDLQQTESMARYSLAVTRLARNVSTSFLAYRELMRQYESNIELVDPQLKNNEPLVKTMTEFENSWSLAQS